VKSSVVLKGPSPKVPRSRVARRFCASAVTAGMMPSGGSTMSDVCLNARRAKSLRNDPMSFSARLTPVSICLTRAANAWSLK
jgi:hypothetical protein